MQFDEYVQGLLSRYQSLDEKEKEAVRKFKETKNGQLMMQLLGPEFAGLFNRLAAPKAKGLGGRR